MLLFWSLRNSLEYLIWLFIINSLNIIHVPDKVLKYRGILVVLFFHYMYNVLLFHSVTCEIFESVFTVLQRNLIRNLIAHTHTHTKSNIRRSDRTSAQGAANSSFADANCCSCIAFTTQSIIQMPQQGQNLETSSASVFLPTVCQPAFVNNSAA